MDDDREYREVDDETFDRYVRYAFHPTAEPAGDGSTVEDPSEGEGSATDGAEAGPEVERFDRGLYRPDSDDPVAVAGWHDFRARIRAGTTGSAASRSSPRPPSTAGRGTSAS